MAKTILVAEDNPEIRDIIRATLEFAGYEVVEAVNGQEALDAIARHGSFDLILSDIQMPVMDGIELVKKCRAGAAPTTPILALSAEMEQTINEVKQAGANSAIVKPFEPIHLLNELERLIP